MKKSNPRCISEHAYVFRSGEFPIIKTTLQKGVRLLFLLSIKLLFSHSLLSLILVHSPIPLQNKGVKIKARVLHWATSCVSLLTTVPFRSSTLIQVSKSALLQYCPAENAKCF